MPSRDHRRPSDELEQPLLLPPTVLPGTVDVDVEVDDGDNPTPTAIFASIDGGDTSLVGSIVLLSKAIVGAGSAALPLAFARLGIFFSVTFLLTVAFMTHFSLQALTQGLITSGRTSYPSAVHSLVGPSPASFLELCLVLRCAGLIVVYIVIAADLLAGSKSLPGLLCEIFGKHAHETWCADRHLAAGVVTVAILLPLVTPKKLSSATFTSFLGLSAVMLWTVVTAGVALTAGIDHKGVVPPLLPNPEALGGGNLASELIVALATLPVIATAFTCQMTVHFIAGGLRTFSTKRMSIVSAAAVSLCSLVFLTIGLGSIYAFGDRVPADILEMFSTKSLKHIVGKHWAKVFGISVRFGFLLSLLANCPFQMLPYRHSLARLTLPGGGVQDPEFRGLAYYAVTYLSLGLFYFIAMAAKSIWVPIQLVGATAGAAIAFFYPAALALVVAKRMPAATTRRRRYWTWNGWALIVLGVVQVVTGIGAIYLEREKK